MSPPPILFGAAAGIGIFAGPEERAAALATPALGQISFERTTTLDANLARRLALRFARDDGTLRGLAIAAESDNGLEFEVRLDQNFAEFQREELRRRIAQQLDIPLDKVRVREAKPGSVNLGIVVLPPDVAGAQQQIPVLTLAGITAPSTDAKQTALDGLTQLLNAKLEDGSLDLCANIVGRPAVFPGLVNTPAPLIVSRWLAGTLGGDDVSGATVPLLQGRSAAQSLAPVAWGGPGVVGGEVVTGLGDILARVDDVIYAPELGQGGAGALLAVGAALGAAAAQGLGSEATPPCAAYSTDLGNSFRSAGPLLLSGHATAAAYSPAQRRALVVGAGALGGLAATVVESTDLRTWNIVSAADSPESAAAVAASLPDTETGEARVQWIVAGEAQDPARRVRQCSDPDAREWTPIAYPAAGFLRASAALHAPDRVRVQDDRLPRWVLVGHGPDGFLCGPPGTAVAPALAAGSHPYDLSLALAAVDYGTDASGDLLFLAAGWGESSDPLAPSPCTLFASADGETWAGVAGSADLFPPGAVPARVAFDPAARLWAALAPGPAPDYAHTLATSADGRAGWTTRAFAAEGEGGARGVAPLAPLLRPLEINAQPAGADLANLAPARDGAAGEPGVPLLSAGDKRAAVWDGPPAAREEAQGMAVMIREAAQVEVWGSEDAGAQWRPLALAAPPPPRRLAAAAALDWPASPLGTRLVVAGGEDAAEGAQAGAPWGAGRADVWASDDGGESWSLLAATAPWGARRGHALVAVSGELLLLGGQRADTGAVLADVWASGDGGATWSTRAAPAPWAPRMGHVAAAGFVNGGGGLPPVYVLAGADASGVPLPSAAARVWRSLDAGASWELRNANPPFRPRAHAAGIVLPSLALLVLGGEDASGNALADGTGALEHFLSADGGINWSSDVARGETPGVLPAPRRAPALALAERTDPLTRQASRDLYLLGGENRADLWRGRVFSSLVFWERLAADAGAGPRTAAALLAIPTPDCGCPDKLRLVGGEQPVHGRRMLTSADGGATWGAGGADGGASEEERRRLTYVPPAQPRLAQLARRTRALAAAPDRMLLAVGEDAGAATLAPPPHLDPAGAAQWQDASAAGATGAGARLVAALFLPAQQRFLAVATPPTALDPEEEGPLPAAPPPSPPGLAAAAALLRADIIDGTDPAQLAPWAPADAVTDAPHADSVRWRAAAYAPQLGRAVAVGWGGAGGGNARVLWSDDGGATWSGLGVQGVPDAAWWGVAWSPEKARFVAVGPGAPPRVRRLVRSGAAAFDTPELNPPGRRARVMVSADGKVWREAESTAPAPLAAVLWSSREGVFAATCALGGVARERLLLSADGDRWFSGVRERAAAAEGTGTDGGERGERALGAAYVPAPRALCLLGRRAPARTGRALVADTVLAANNPLYAWETPADPADPAGPLPTVTLGFDVDSGVAQALAERDAAAWRGPVGLPTPLSGPGVVVAYPSPLHDALIDPLLAPAPPLPPLRLFLGAQEAAEEQAVADDEGAAAGIAQARGWPERVRGARFVADAAQAPWYRADVSGQVDFARPAAGGVVDAFPTTLVPAENPFPFALAWDTRRYDLSLSELFIDVALAENALLYQDALARRSDDAWIGIGVEPAGAPRFRVLDVPASPLAPLFAGTPPDTIDLLVGVPPPRSDTVEQTHTTGAWAADISLAPLQVPGAEVFAQKLPEDEEAAPPAFPRRSAHAAFALGGGAHLVVGGLGVSALLDDAWASSDGGETWAQVAAGVAPPARAHAAHALWRGPGGDGPAECVLAGGIGPSLARLDDVWASTDGGATWARRDAGGTGAPFGARRAAGMVALAPDHPSALPAPAPAELILVGGEALGADASGNPAPVYRADVWASSDGGVTWVTRAQGCPWGGRAEFALAALPAHAVSEAAPSPALVLTGGMRQGRGRAGDTWVSLDRGATWTRQPDAQPGQPAWSARRGHSMVATQDASGSLLLLAGGEGRPATRSSTLTCPFCDLWASRDLGASWFNVPNFGAGAWSARYHHRMTLDETSASAAVLLTGGFLAITFFAADTYFSRAIAGPYGWDPFLLGVRLRIRNEDAALFTPGLEGTQDLAAILGGSGELRIVRVPPEED